jgi:hypothetical protein
MAYKIAQLTQTSSRNANTISDVFIAQPDSVKENLGGKLFVLIEISPKKNESIKIANFLIDNLNHNYYQNEKIILRERLSSLTVESIFESAIAKTNKNFLEFLETEKIKTNLDNINIAAGVIHDDGIFFSASGKNKFFLIYKNKKENKESEYKIIDILKKSSQGERMAKIKLFDNVMSGQIPEKGCFLITNEALPEYISEKQLIEIITNLPPISAIEQIKNTLNKINSYVPFLAIIIKSTSLSLSEETQKILPRTSSESIVDLNKTEENTEILLTPSGIIDFNKWIGFFLGRFKFFKPKITSSSQLSLRDKIFIKKRTIEWFKKILLILSSIALLIFNSVISLFKLLTNKQKILLFYQISKNKLKNLPATALSFYKKLGKKGKILLLICLIFLVLFLINTYLLKNNNQKAENENKYNEITSSIEQKQNQAEANLLYNNEEGVKKLFDEISTLLQQFPQETADQKAQYDKFKKKFDEQMEKIRHVVNINNAEEVVNLNSLNSQANPENLIINNNKIYSADSAQKSIYVFSVIDKKTTTYTEITKNINKFSSPILTKNQSIYYYNQDSIIEFDTQKENLKVLPIENISNFNFTGIGLYNDRLYLFNNDNIYRSDKLGSGYSKPSVWLKEKADLSNAQNMIIDGNIYILKNNGEVLKFLSGKSVNFTISDAEPKIEDARKFAIYNNTYYILEPKNKRLVVYNKDGKFSKQYKANKFNNLKDFLIDEKNKIIYFLNETSIYKITIE